METHEHNEKPYDFCYLPLLTYITKNKIACLAQLVEHLPCKEKVTSSNLVTSIIVAPICIDSIRFLPIMSPAIVSIAQLVEHLTVNQVVAGSNPVGYVIEDDLDKLT